jgi:hypothetical protein
MTLCTVGYNEKDTVNQRGGGKKLTLETKIYRTNGRTGFAMIAGSRKETFKFLFFVTIFKQK